MGNLFLEYRMHLINDVYVFRKVITTIKASLFLNTIKLYYYLCNKLSQIINVYLTYY